MLPNFKKPQHKESIVTKHIDKKHQIWYHNPIFSQMEIPPIWLKYKVAIRHKLNCLTCFTSGKLAKGHHKILFACLYDTYSQYDGYENN